MSRWCLQCRLLYSAAVPEGPVCVFDLTGVRDNFRALAQASIRYAVTVNPAHPVLRLLAAKGAEFGVASVTPFGHEFGCDLADASTAFNGCPPMAMHFVEATGAVPAG